MPFLEPSRTFLARKAGIKSLPRLVAKTSKIDGVPAALVDPGIGAPAAVLTLEECIQRGYRDFLFLGACGGIENGLRIGDIVLPEEAISEEGTSRLYTRAGPIFKPNANLTNMLEKAALDSDLNVHRGLVWTTDAPYRETPARISRYKRLGAIGVDMESSALFAVAGLRKARLAGLLVVSDLLHDKWVIGWNRKAYRAAEDKARGIVVNVAVSLADNARRRSG